MAGVGYRSCDKTTLDNQWQLGQKIDRIFYRENIPLEAMLLSYLPVIIFIAISAVIGIALLAAPFLLAFKAPDAEKLSPYECGFNPFDDARMKFDVRFYLVAILFIIFDLEVAFLFPGQLVSANWDGSGFGR